MRWKQVVRAGCVLSAVFGCATVRRPAAGDSGSPAGAHPTEREVRGEARAAWQAVAARSPRVDFSGAFRDGFLDGYVDAAEGTGPVVRFAGDVTRPPGLWPDWDYHLGLRSGSAAARGGGRNPPADAARLVVAAHATFGVPVAAPAAGEPSRSDEPVAAAGSDRPHPKLPKPELPVIRPFNPDLSGGPFALPTPHPATEPRDGTAGAPDPLPLPVSAPPAELPAILSDARVSPATTLPAILGQIPVIPFRPAGADDAPPPVNR
jgi:hypothetical protein